jgi:hypothetical protein
MFLEMERQDCLFSHLRLKDSKGMFSTCPFAVRNSASSRVRSAGDAEAPLKTSWLSSSKSDEGIL